MYFQAAYRILDNSYTVSYTHLDVYKRQPKSAAKGLITPLVFSALADDTILRPCQRRNGPVLNRLEYAVVNLGTDGLEFPDNLFISDDKGNPGAGQVISCLLYTSLL